MLYRVGRKRLRAQSLHTADIMRSPLRTLNAKGIQTPKNMKSLNLLNSVVQNNFPKSSSFNNHKTSPGLAFYLIWNTPLGNLYAPWVGIIGRQFSLITCFVRKESVFALGQEGCVEGERLRCVLAVDTGYVPCVAMATCNYHPFSGITSEQSGLVPCGGQCRHEVLHLLGLHEIALRFVSPMQ